jgi:hypothetical protein
MLCAFPTTSNPPHTACVAPSTVPATGMWMTVALAAALAAGGLALGLGRRRRAS